MKTFILLPYSLLFISLQISAQNEDDILNDGHSAGAARKARHESLWSLTSANTNKWKIPVHNNNGWTTSRINKTVPDINVPASSRASSTKARVSSSSGRSKAFQQQMRNLHLGNLNMARARAEAEARAAEERRQKSEENKRDFQQGVIQHQMMTHDMYASLAQRDYWNATVGAIQLDESIHALDIANVPVAAQKEVPQINGNDLAEMLKPKKEQLHVTITVLDNSIMVKDFQLGVDSKRLDVTKNTILDEGQIEAWKKAMEETVMINSVPSIKTHDSNNSGGRNYEVLFSKDDIDIDSLSLFLLPQYGLVALAADSMVVLKEPDLPTLTWIDGGFYSHVVICGEALIGKSGNSIFNVREQDSQRLLELDTEDISLFACDNYNFFVVCYYDDLSSIMKVNLQDKTANELVRIPARVWSVASNGSTTLLLVENDIYVLTSAEVPRKIYTDDNEVYDIVLSPIGLLIATNKAILLVRDMTHIEVFCSKGACRLWCDGNDVFAQTTDGELIYFEQITD